MRFIVNQYFADEPMDQAEHAPSSPSPPTTRDRPGWPACGARPRQQGLDPNVWFDNVEVIAARDIGRETVQYVSNIFKYYVAYKFEVEARNAEDAARAAVKKQS